MSRISQVFKQKSAYIAYITGGDGGLKRNVEVAKALIEAGVDVLEIGIPHSDPVADGLVIQAAMYRSLEAGTTPRLILELACEIRKFSDTPLVLFSYYNPILQGGSNFLKEARQAGFDGLLVVDLPFEELEEQLRMNQSFELESIMIATPTTTQERLEKITEHARGFIYYVIQKGTTGIRDGLPSDLMANLRSIKKAAQTPVVAGFGISTRESAAAVLQGADGFVVGSAFVKAISEGATAKQIHDLAKSIDPR